MVTHRIREGSGGQWKATVSRSVTSPFEHIPRQRPATQARRHSVTCLVTVYPPTSRAEGEGEGLRSRENSIKSQINNKTKKIEVNRRVVILALSIFFLFLGTNFFGGFPPNSIQHN